ncbi:TPA: hypothetical protein PTV97_003772 [Clostridium botulinum]|nr:hypothetical protein [Clostridium botulinum]
MDKNKPTKVINFESRDSIKCTWNECPNCRKRIGGSYKQTECPYCSQKIIWK